LTFLAEILSKAYALLANPDSYRILVPYAMTPRQLYVLDTAVTLHQSNDVELDLTLLRGRVYLSNRKPDGPAKVRLRFGENQMWDISLSELRNEVALDFGQVSRLDIAGEEPYAELNLALIRGEASINVNAYDEYNETALAPRPVRLRWDNLRGFGFDANTPMQKVAELPREWYNRRPPASTSSGFRRH
jgi:hypothetical protein